MCRLPEANAEAMSAALGGLGINGKLIVLGAPHEPLEVSAGVLIGGRRSVAGWYSGTSIDSQDTLSFSTLTGVRAMTEVYPLERAAEAYERLMSGKSRFRVVLTTGQGSRAQVCVGVVFVLGDGFDSETFGREPNLQPVQPD